MSGKVTAARVSERRDFLRSAASLAAVIAASGCATTGSTQKGQTAMSEGESKEAEVTPGEDLMQEHGVLERILLLYDESIRRIDSNQPLDTGVVAKAAGIVRRFVEDYHEKLEEQFVFPRLQAMQRELDLVSVLLRQHQRGRLLTDDILRRASAAAGPELALALRSFGRMYRPHAAREDTVLFPAFRDVMGRAGYRELGEQFEHKEHELFGEGGFRTIVAQVADLERALGIHDLASFTPV